MVTKCICFDKDFSELKRIIDNKKLKSFEELQEIITFGKNCALCVPYVKQIFITGKTEFEPILTTEKKSE